MRLEFFGDEIDAVRRMVPSTGQTIGDIAEVQVFPCRELALSAKAIERCRRRMYQAAQDDDEIAQHMEFLEQGVVFPELDRYLPQLYAATSIPLAHVCPEALMVLAEPRSLFDDATRAYDEIAQAAREKHIDLAGLYIKPTEMDFGCPAAAHARLAHAGGRRRHGRAAHPAARRGGRFPPDASPRLVQAHGLRHGLCHSRLRGAPVDGALAHRRAHPDSWCRWAATPRTASPARR